MADSIEKKHINSCHRTCSSHDGRVAELPCFIDSTNARTNGSVAVVVWISLYLSSCCDVSDSNLAIASASVGQVHKTRTKRGSVLETAIGRVEAAKWGSKTVAIKIEKPDAAEEAGSFNADLH